jgi:exodeoxyribonuclease V alpha subunit
MLINLSGRIERITFFNPENGFTIARVNVYGQKDLVTVAGNMLAPNPGEILQMTGRWRNHPKFGEQFEIVNYQTKVPATIYGIKKYLGSGLIKGIGPIIAERIVNQFGEKTLDIIEDETEKLTLVDGIGKMRLATIKQAWADQKEIRTVMLFLQSHGVSAAYATKIFKQYGDQAIAVVKENPYRLATDIFGIGFVTADKIAGQLGFEKDSPMRAQAGIIYVLHQLAGDGHVYYPYQPLLSACSELLDIDAEIIRVALAEIAISKHIVIENLNERVETFQENYKAVYLKKYHFCENQIAVMIKELMTAKKTIRPINCEKALDWVQSRLNIQLAQKQMEAVQTAVKSKAMIITGGPGTGKTTIINAILKIVTQLKIKILLAAPTGRAAKRMSEATGRPAQTIHRMLAFSFKKGGFQKNEKSPLDCDLIIVDEASMIDTVLMYYLLKAIPAQATFILVGDVHQLPSVGPGTVLSDIIASKTLPVVALNRIFRQAQKSRIIVNAHKINRGKIPSFSSPTASLTTNDFFFIEQANPQRVLDIILTLAARRIPRRFGFDPVEDIQVLTPMHKGVVGAGNLNTQLQQTLNSGQKGLIWGNREYRIHDKVMQIRNNYDKEVFNGDIGRIHRISAEEQELHIIFDDRKITYDFAELDEITLAYAVSVHKAQGSEFPVVVMPVLIQHYMLLQRNLIYTAITRAKKLAVMVGTRKALAIAVKNSKTSDRFAHLDQRLKDLF